MTRHPVPERTDDNRSRCPIHHHHAPCPMCRVTATHPTPTRPHAGTTDQEDR